MADHLITMPDGTRATVTAPDDADMERIFSFAHAIYSASGLDLSIPEYVKSQQESAEVKPSIPSGNLDIPQNGREEESILANFWKPSIRPGMPTEDEYFSRANGVVIPIGDRGVINLSAEGDEKNWYGRADAKFQLARLLGGDIYAQFGKSTAKERYGGITFEKSF